MYASITEAFHDADSIVIAVLSDSLTISSAEPLLKTAGMQIGTQDVCPRDKRPYAGKVSDSDLASFGASVIEIEPLNVAHIITRTIPLSPARTPLLGVIS